MTETQGACQANQSVHINLLKRIRQAMVEFELAGHAVDNGDDTILTEEEAMSRKRRLHAARWRLTVIRNEIDTTLTTTTPACV